MHTSDTPLRTLVLPDARGASCWLLPVTSPYETLLLAEGKCSILEAEAGRLDSLAPFQDSSGRFFQFGEVCV